MGNLARKQWLAGIRKGRLDTVSGREKRSRDRVISPFITQVVTVTGSLQNNLPSSNHILYTFSSTQNHTRVIRPASLSPSSYFLAQNLDMAAAAATSSRTTRTASMSSLEATRGTHTFKIAGYSLHRSLVVNVFVTSTRWSSLFTQATPLPFSTKSGSGGDGALLIGSRPGQRPEPRRGRSSRHRRSCVTTA